MDSIGSEINFEDLKSLISYVLKTAYRSKDKDRQVKRENRFLN